MSQYLLARFASCLSTRAYISPCVCLAVEKKFPGDRDRLARMSLIEEGYPQQIRMANLACIGESAKFLLPWVLILSVWYR